MKKTIDLNLPEKLLPFCDPAPYKIAYGGRGGGKSRTIAKLLVAKGVSKKCLILCTRELQKSIADSVHRVLSNAIKEMGLNDFYDILNHKIVGKNGTEFIFYGLRNNASEIKSTEGITDCWCEEAEAITERSWDILIPTIREDNAEIWISFNPDDEMGETWQRFVVDPPKGAIVVQINYWDNKWFPPILRNQMEEMKRKNYQKYLHVWEGQPNADYDDSIVRPEWFDAAIDAHKKIPFEATGVRVVGFDPADDGSDAKAIAYRHGSVIEYINQWSDGDISDAIPRAFDYADEKRAEYLVYDSVGIGASIKVALKARGPTERINYTGFGGGDGVDYP